MKTIRDLSPRFDGQDDNIESIKNYNDAIFELRKFLRFDGDRFTIIDNRQTSHNTWQFTVRSADGSQDAYSASIHGFVRHIPHA